METITLKVEKSDIYEEVGTTTDYTGSKLVSEEDKDVRDRILTTEEDLATLGRFWDETAAAASDKLKAMLRQEINDDEKYEVVLEVSRSFDKELVPSIESSLRSFFILTISGKWFLFANKGEADGYVSRGMEMMEDIRRKLYSRMRPKSPRKRDLPG